MNRDRFSKLDTTKIKAKYDFMCNHCGCMENIQAHDPTGSHIDWREGIALCGECHSKEHPDVPKDLFLPSEHQPYWPNISARALAEEFGVCSRTIVRHAKRLNISPIYPLSDDDKERLRSPYTYVNMASEDEIMLQTKPKRTNELRRYREERGLRQKDLAEMLGVMRPLVSLWENDHALPTRQQVERIAEILGKPAVMIFDIE